MADALLITCDLALAPAPAVDRVIEELTSALERLSIDFEPGPGGRVTERGVVVGGVVTWEPGHRAAFRWRPASWEPDEVTSVELRVDPSDRGSTITLDRGRFVGLGSDPELRDTPGAPEPMASRLRFYDDAELERLGRAGGFADVRVVRRDLEAFAREAGVPEEHVPLFAAKPGEGPRFLICRA